MEWGSIVTWIVTRSPALSSLATIVGVFLQLLENGASFSRRNSLRSSILFHQEVYKYYGRMINRQLNDEFDGFHLKWFLIFWFVIAFLFVIALLSIAPHLSDFEIFVISVWLSFVISPILPVKKVLERTLRSLSNVSIPVFFLGLLVFYPLIVYDDYNESLILSYAILAFITEILWLLLVSWSRLLTSERELDILKDHESIKSSIFGLLMTLIISGVLVVIWVTWTSSLQKRSQSNLPTLRIASLGSVALIAFLGFIALTYVVSNVKERALRLLWKAEVGDFASNLPHLLVKTKTGNIYYGQLYDPLDSKVLVLRKSKLMHDGQIVEDNWTSQESAGDYWIIPWNDIESIKIIEEGLYFPPESSTDNFISQSTDNDFKEEKSRKNAETDSKPRT